MCKSLNGVIQADLFKMLAKFCTYRKLMVFFIEKSKSDVKFETDLFDLKTSGKGLETWNKSHTLPHRRNDDTLYKANIQLNSEKCLFYWMKISRGRRRVTASLQHTKADSRTVIPYNVQQDLLCSFNFNDENHLKMKFIIRFPN